MKKTWTSNDGVTITLESNNETQLRCAEPIHRRATETLNLVMDLLEGSASRADLAAHVARVVTDSGLSWEEILALPCGGQDSEDAEAREH